MWRKGETCAILETSCTRDAALSAANLRKRKAPSATFSVSTAEATSPKRSPIPAGDCILFPSGLTSYSVPLCKTRTILVSSYDRFIAGDEYSLSEAIPVFHRGHSVSTASRSAAEQY